MLAAICISVFQYYSLLMSSASGRAGAVVDAIGFTLTSMGYVLIVYGIYYFPNTLKMGSRTRNVDLRREGGGHPRSRAYAASMISFRRRRRGWRSGWSSSRA